MAQESTRDPSLEATRAESSDAEANGPRPSGEDDRLAQSFLAALRTAKASPESDDAWDHVEDLAASLTRPDDVARAYREALASPISRVVREPISQRAVRFFDEWYGDTPHAVSELLSEIVAKDPDATWAFDRLTMRLTVDEQWSELLALYDRALQTTADKERRKQLLDDAAHIAKDFAQASAQAVDYMLARLELEPGNEKLAAAIERLLERQARWQDLIDLWQARLSDRSAAETRPIRLRIALTYLEHLAAPRPALAEIEIVLDETPGNAQACELLDRILDAEDAPVALRLQALSLLRSNYKAAGLPAKVVEALERAIPIADPGARLALHREAGNRLGVLGQDAPALDHYAALLAQDPTDADARRQMRQLARRSGLHAAHVDALVAASASAEPGQAAALLAEAAHLCRTETGDRERAIELYRRVADLGDAERSLATSAAHHLVELLGAAGRDDERLAGLESLAALETASAVRRSVLGEAGRLADALGDPDRALTAYAARLADDDRDLDAFHAQIDILRRCERWHPLATALSRRAEVSVVAQQRRADLIETARIQADKLGDTEAAVATWLSVRETFGDELETIAALDGLMSERERFSDLAQVLEGTASLWRAQAAGLLRRLGEIQQHGLGRSMDATRYYAQTLTVEPSDETARAGLASLIADEGCRDLAVESLVTAYRATDDWQNLLELAEARLESAGDPLQQVEVLRETAGIRERRGNDYAGALQAVARALVLDPDSSPLEHELLRLADATGEWERAAQALGDAAVAAAHAPRSADLRRREGLIREERLDDARGAVNAYAAAAAADPDDLATRRAVIRTSALAATWTEAADACIAVCLAREVLDMDAIDGLVGAADVRSAWDQLCAAFETAIDEAPLSSQLARDLEVQLATWHRDRRADPSAARAAALRAVAHSTDHEPTLRLLATIEHSLPLASGEPHPRICETLLKVDALAERDLDPLYDAARIALEHGTDPDWVYAVVARLFRKSARLFAHAEAAEGTHQTEPTAMWALERLVDLDLAARRRDAAIQMLMSASDLPLARDAVLDLRMRAAALCADAGDARRAIDLYGAILAERTGDLGLIRTLAGLCEREGRLLELVRCRTRELDLTEDAARQLDLRLQLSRLVGELEAEGGRVQSLLANLDQSPGHDASVDALRIVFVDKGQHAQWTDVLTEQARRLEPTAPGRSAELWAEVAALSERQFSDFPRAISALRRVSALQPASDPLDDLARLLLATDDPAAAADVIRERLNLTDEGTRLPVLLRLARAQLAAEQNGAAITTLEEAFQHSPRSAEVRKLLLRLYRTHEWLEPLARALTVAVEHITDSATILSYAREAAQLYQDRLDRPDLAVPVLERAHELATGDRKLKSRLADGLLAAGRTDDARALLEGLIAEFGRRRSPERAAAHLQLAHVARACGNVDEAIDELERAATMDSANPSILQTLAETARDAGQLERAERAYRGLLIGVRRRGDDRPERDDVPGPAEVLYQLSRISVLRDNPEQAEELVESVLEALAEHDDEGPRLQRRLEADGEVALLRRVLDARLEFADDDRRKAAILGDLAELQAKHLDAPEDALRSWFEALDRDPAAPRLHQQTIALADELGKRDAYVERLQLLLDKSRRNNDLYVRCELLLRLAEAMEQRQDFVRGRELVGQAENLGVREVDVWRVAARLAGAHGDRETQVAYLERLAELGEAEGENRVDALYRMAEVYLADAEFVARGLTTLQQALEADPKYERACRILIRSANESVDPELLALYEKVARQTQDPATILDALARCVTQPQTEPELVREAVTLALGLEQSERAEALMMRAVELAESVVDGDRRVAWAMRGLAERRKAVGDLAGAVKWLCEAIEHGEVRELFGLARAISVEAETEGGDLTLAVRVYETMLERDPSAREAWEPLAELYRSLGDIDRLQQLVEETLDGLGSVEERNALRMNLAQTLGEHPGRERDAIEALQNVLLEEPGNETAAATLVDLFERTSSEDDLIALLGRRLMVAQERQDATAITRAALGLAERQARADIESAIATLRTAADWSPRDPILLRSLRSYLSPVEHASERAVVTEQLIAVEDPAIAAELALELADAHAMNDDAEGELAALVMGYRRDPGHERLRTRLEHAYEQTGDYRGLALMLVTAADEIDDPTAQVAMLRQAATIHRELLSDPEISAEILERAHAAVPEDAELALELASALASGGQLRRALALVNELMDDESRGPQERLGLLSTRADLRAALGDRAGTTADLEAAFAIDPDAVAARLAEAIELERSAASEADDGAAVRRGTLRLVTLLARLGERDQARSTLLEWVEQERKDSEALAMLRDFEAEDENWEAVAKLSARLVAVETGDAQIAAAIALADACEKMGRPEDARAGIEHARRKQPKNHEIRALLRAIYERSGADKELARLLLQEADESEDVEDRIGLLRRASEILLAEGDTESALPVVQEILQHVPGDPVATVSLADAYLGIGEIGQAEVVLDDAITESKGRRSPELAVLYHRKACVAAAQGDPQTQFGLLQQAFAVDKTNGHIAADMADLAEALEQWDLAVRVLRTITLIEGPCRIDRAHAFIRQARISLLRGDRQRGVLWARKARHESPDDPEIEAFWTSLGEG